MLKWINKKRNKKGFTLIELVVVIAILGILAGIAVPRLSGAQDNAKLKADMASARTLAGAISIAMVESDESLYDKTIDIENQTIEVNDEEITIVPNYINEWPKVQSDPSDGESEVKGFVVEIDDVGIITIKADGVEVKPDFSGYVEDGE